MSALYAVLGHPIAHSLSPALHAAGFRALGKDATYEALDVPASEYKPAIQALIARGIAGANLTAPLKGVGLFFADDQTDDAMDSGAANTLRFEGGKIFAHNTDGLGFVRFLERAGCAPRDRAVAFLGGGGAAAGLTNALRNAGARLISAVVRNQLQAATYPGLSKSDGVRLLRWGSPEAERAIGEAKIVVQATPLGQRAEDGMPCPVEWLGPEALAVDLLYHPAESPWLRALRGRGLRAANGLGLLVEQALLAEAFWFEVEPPRSALEEALPWSDPFTPPAQSSAESPSA